MPPPVKNVRKHFRRNTFFLNTRSLPLLINKFSELLSKFDPKYWIMNTGLDGFIYLQFQRTMLKSFLIMGIISLGISIAINMISSAYEGTFSSQTWIIRTTQYNSFFKEVAAWSQVILVILFTIILHSFLSSLTSIIKAEFLREFMEKSSKQNTEWLKMRTAHVFGVPEKDRKGLLLTTMLNNYLKHFGGKILEVEIVPDIQKMFQNEMKRKDIEDISKLVHSSFLNCPTRLLIPSKYLDSSQIKQAIDLLDINIQKETEKPFMCSGHAFVCFDSVHSMERCLQEFMRVDFFKTIKMGFFAIKERICNFINSRRFRTTSTFGHYAEMDIETENIDRPENEMQIYMEHANEPMNINWYNMGKASTRGFFFIRRALFNIFGILVLLFLSIPTIILSHFSSFQSLQEFNVQYIDRIPYSSMFKDYIPPLLIICLNQLLLLLIHQSIYLENHSTYSDYHYAVLGKSLIYFGLNLFLIPSISVATVDSIYSLIYNRNISLSTIIGNFYFEDTSTFFIILILQQACITSAIYLTRINEIISDYLSPWLAHFSRKYITDSAPWRKKLNHLFPFGFMYAQLLTIFLIVLVFSSNVPIIAIAGVIFFFIRHIVDAYILITVNLKEIESSTILGTRVLNVSYLFILIAQFFIFLYFILNEENLQAFAISIIFISTTISTLNRNEKIVDYKKLDEIYLGNRQALSKYIDKWRMAYSHPLYVRKILDEERMSKQKVSEQESKIDIKEDSPLNVPLNNDSSKKF